MIHPGKLNEKYYNSGFSHPLEKPKVVKNQ